MTLADLLENLNEDRWNHWVFVETKDVQATSLCIVMDTFDVELAEDGNLPKVIAEAGYVEFLQIADLIGIANNLGQQKPDFTKDDLIHAVIYYYRNDAFVQLGR